MFTVIQHKPIERQLRPANHPRPEVIDHRRADAGNRTDTAWGDDLPYAVVKHQRDALREAEMIHKKQIKELQKEKDDLIKLYEPTYTENKQLKSIIQHGPDATKVKQLKKTIREFEDRVDWLKRENKNMSEQIKTLLVESKSPDKELERQWKTILTFADKSNNTQNKRGQVQDKAETSNEASPEQNENEGSNKVPYDLQLDAVENEIQTLLNNVRKLKGDKKKVDYALSMNKGALVGNPILQNAINEKLENSLLYFQENVKTANAKSSELKRRLEENAGKESKAKLNKADRQDENNQAKPIIKIKQNTIAVQTDPEPKGVLLSKNKTQKPVKEQNTNAKDQATQTDAITEGNTGNTTEKAKNKDSKNMASHKVSSTKKRIEFANRLLKKPSDEQNVMEESETVTRNKENEVEKPKASKLRSKPKPKHSRGHNKNIGEKEEKKRQTEIAKHKARLQKIKPETAQSKPDNILRIKPTEASDKMINLQTAEQLRKSGYVGLRKHRNNLSKHSRSYEDVRTEGSKNNYDNEPMWYAFPIGSSFQPATGYDGNSIAGNQRSRKSLHGTSDSSVRYKNTAWSEYSTRNMVDVPGNPYDNVLSDLRSKYYDASSNDRSGEPLPDDKKTNISPVNSEQLRDEEESFFLTLPALQFNTRGRTVTERDARRLTKSRV